MSFVISFQGQFKPYSLPELSHNDSVQQVYKTAKSSQKKEANLEVSEFEREFLSAKKKANQNIITKYQKQERDFQEHKTTRYAKDLMHHGIRFLSPKNSISDANSLMKKYGFSHVPILDEEEVLCGIISERDILRKNEATKLKEVMQREVLTCFEKTRIQDIAKIMLAEQIGSIPIIDENYKLTGILTKTDILNFLTKIVSLNDLA